MSDPGPTLEDLIEDTLNRTTGADNRARAVSIAEALLGQEGLRRLIDHMTAKGHRVDAA